MAINLASNILPANGNSFYLLEDTYMKGGFSVRDNVAARDAIAFTNLKVGQLILTVAEAKIWKVKTLVLPTLENPDAVPAVVWEEFLTNGVTDAPADGKVYGRKNNTWVEAGAGGGGGFNPNSRLVLVHTIDSLPTSTFVEFPIQLAPSAVMLKLTVDRPVKVSIFGTPAKDESNPYQFIATSDHLTDDGSMLLTDGTVFRSRNFSILANMESTTSDMLYFTVASVDAAEGPVNITITYLPLEILAPVVTSPTGP